jgi:hypothetical protein
MKARLRIRLAVIFAALHLIVVGTAILESDGDDEEGLAYVLALCDFPLYAMCDFTAICGHKYYGPVVSGLFFLVAGTLMYAVVGFLVGAVIDWVRTLIARHSGDG